MVLIEPVIPVWVGLKIGHKQYDCQMVSLSDTILELNTCDFLEKKISVVFFAKFFRGQGTIIASKYAEFSFTYRLEIQRIHYQPGFLINTRL